MIREGASLLTTKGWADEEAGELFRGQGSRGKTLGRDPIKTHRLRAEVAIGLWSNCLSAATSGVASRAGRLFELAERSGDHDIRIVAYRARDKRPLAG